MRLRDLPPHVQDAARRQVRPAATRRAATDDAGRDLPRPICCTIVGPPATKKNSGEIVRGGRRGTGRPFLLPSAAYRRWARLAIPQLAACARAHGPVGVPVTLAATVYRARRVGDLINYLQAIQDVLQDAGVLVDDRWVESLDGSRLALDRANPRVEITLIPMQSED